MIFSFFCQKNRFDVNKEFQLYFDYEMSIFGVGEQSKVDNSIVADQKQSEHADEPLNKFKVCTIVLNLNCTRFTIDFFIGRDE